MSFSYDGELFTLKEGEQPKKVSVTITTQAIANTDSYININGGVREMSVSPDGKEIAFIARGEVFVTSVDGALTKRITNTPQQEVCAVAPDGKSIVYASERDGRWQIYQSKKSQGKRRAVFFMPVPC